jgi:hypothetical protein
MRHEKWINDTLGNTKIHLIFLRKKSNLSCKCKNYQWVPSLLAEICKSFLKDGQFVILEITFTFKRSEINVKVNVEVIQLEKLVCSKYKK